MGGTSCSGEILSGDTDSSFGRSLEENEGRELWGATANQESEERRRANIIISRLEDFRSSRIRESFQRPRRGGKTPVNDWD